MSDYFEKKHDEGKRKWSLLPWDSLEKVVEILEFGAEKYGKESWKTVPDAENRYMDALLRHIIAYQNGEINDPESGKNHLAHAACNILFLLYFSGKEKKLKLQNDIAYMFNELHSNTTCNPVSYDNVSENPICPEGHRLGDYICCKDRDPSKDICENICFEICDNSE